MNGRCKMMVWGAIAVIASIGLAQCAKAMEVARDGENTLNVDGRLQMLFAVESMDNHGWKDDDRLLLFMKQARMNINGQYKGCDYELQVMFGGEEVSKSRSGSVLNADISLLDAYVNVPFVKDTFEVKAGQFKVPYGRERLLDSGVMLNAERSIQNNFFNLGHDIGGAVHTRSGSFAAALGVFAGTGINTPQRYIPVDLGVPLTVARVGVNNGLDKDIFTPYETEVRKADGVKYAAFVNAAYTEDSRAGHSTPINVKSYDSAIMFNPNWNPYVKAADQKAEFYQVGGDAAVQIPLSDDSALLMSVEANFASFDNDDGDLESSGGLAAINYMKGDWNFGIRYAAVQPDENMAYAATDSTTKETTLHSITDKTISEITPSIAYDWKEYGLKIKADFSIMMDVPLSIEEGHGLYNLMLQPDSTSYGEKGGFELQDVYVAKVVVQYDF